jgi:hypothetical protein
MFLGTTKYSLIAILALVSGCTAIKDDEVMTSRYQFDRTLSLYDIAPVAPAYLELPHPECDVSEVKSLETIRADIDSSREKRVYWIGGQKCVISTK